MTEVDIRALANLAQMEVSEEELKTLGNEVPKILSFIETIQKALRSEESKSVLQNVMREDDNPHESGLYTERLLNSSPSREKDKIAVPQVVKRQK